MAGMFRFYAGLPAGTAVGLTFVIRLATLWFAALVGIVGLLIVRARLGDVAPGEGADIPPRVGG